MKYLYDWYFPKEDRWWFQGSNPKYKLIGSVPPTWPAKGVEEMAHVMWESMTRTTDLEDSIAYFMEVK